MKWKEGPNKTVCWKMWFEFGMSERKQRRRKLRTIIATRCYEGSPICRKLIHLYGKYSKLYFNYYYYYIQRTLNRACLHGRVCQLGFSFLKCATIYENSNTHSSASPVASIPLVGSQVMHLNTVAAATTTKIKQTLHLRIRCLHLRSFTVMLMVQFGKHKHDDCEFVVR